MASRALRPSRRLRSSSVRTVLPPRAKLRPSWSSSSALRRIDRMRIRADIWVAAYLRRCAVEGAVAVLRRRGAAEAGAIFVKVDRLDGRAALYAPAPQSELGEDGLERLWSRAHKDEWIAPGEIETRL